MKQPLPPGEHQPSETDQPSARRTTRDKTIIDMLIDFGAIIHKVKTTDTPDALYPFSAQDLENLQIVGAYVEGLALSWSRRLDAGVGFEADAGLDRDDVVGIAIFARAFHSVIASTLVERGKIPYALIHSFSHYPGRGLEENPEGPDKAKEQAHA